MSTPFFFLQSDEATLCAALRKHDLRALRRVVVDDLDPGALGRELAAWSGEALDVWFGRMMAEPDPAAPRERGLFWAVPPGVPRAREAGQTLFYCLVDPGLFDLVMDLYAAGHPTTAGCEGRSHAEQFTKRCHDPHAYLGFEAPMPEHVQRALEADGMRVYMDGCAVCSIDIHSDGSERPGSVRGYRKVTETRMEEDFRDDAIRAVLAANAAFVPRMRRAFGLP
jgi:hypothetical protein